MIHAIAVLHCDIYERIKQGIGEQVRLQPQIDQLGVLRVVVMLLGFDTRVGQVIDFHIEAQVFPGNLNFLRQIEHGKLLGELVVDAAFALSRRIQAGNLNATNGIANIQEAAGLSALTVNG
jgi:hypothetical protein